MCVCVVLKVFDISKAFTFILMMVIEHVAHLHETKWTYTHIHNISWMNVWIQNYKWMNNLSLFSSVFWGSTTESTMICVSMEYFTICIINEQIFKWYRDKYFFHRSGAPKYMYYIQRRFVHLAPHLKQKKKKKICNKNKFFFIAFTT